MTSNSPIEFVNLRKEYGSFTAVNNLNLKIKKNSFTGLLGPNGAGKSTSLKILTNLTRATSGNAYLNGYDVADDAKNALAAVGTVVETPEFYMYMTPRETFKYIGEIYGMSKESIASETDTIMNKVGMTEWADKKLGTFSKGMRQRIALGLSLMNDPHIIILDEPTSGLDPRGMAETRAIMKNIRNDNNNLTIIMSSHMMHEVSDLCDRIAIINHGKLILHDDIEKVISGSNAHTIVVKTIAIPDEGVISAVANLDCVKSATRSGNEISVKFMGEKEEEAEFFKQLAQFDFGVYSVSESSNALEDRYLELIKESR